MIMPAPIDRIFEAVTDYSKTMGNLHGDYLKIVKRDIDRFLEKTGDLQSQMYWQAGTVFAVGALGASLAVAGSLIPKGADPASSTLNNPRLEANGARDILKSIGEKFKDSQFLRQTCKTSAKLFNQVGESTATAYHRAKTTKLEADRELIQMCYREGQQEKSVFDQEVRRAQDSALSILQSKAKA